MATIDKLDLSVYNMYANRTRLLEQINDQYHLDQASTIPPQTFLVDNSPRASELDILLGTPAMQRAAWANFTPPPKFSSSRRSPFAFFNVVPSFDNDEEKEERKRDDIICDTEEEENEKKTLKVCMKQVKTINEWLKDIVGRMGQFLQG